MKRFTNTDALPLAALFASWLAWGWIGWQLGWADAAEWVTKALEARGL